MRKLMFGLIVGFVVGYQLGRKAIGGPEATAEAAAQGRRLVGGAARVGLQAVQRARSTIQSRLGGETNPEWN